jgi:hypothetical protein
MHQGTRLSESLETLAHAFTAAADIMHEIEAAPITDEGALVRGTQCLCRSLLALAEGYIGSTAHAAPLASLMIPQADGKP